MKKLKNRHKPHKQTALTSPLISKLLPSFYLPNLILPTLTLNLDLWFEPLPTENQLDDVIKWIKHGSLVILYDNRGNPLGGNSENAKHSHLNPLGGNYKCYYNNGYITDYYNVRIIVIEFIKSPTVVDYSKWHHYIQLANCKDCSSETVITNINRLILENQTKVVKNLFIFHHK